MERSPVPPPRPEFPWPYQSSEPVGIGFGDVRLNGLIAEYSADLLLGLAFLILIAAIRSALRPKMKVSMLPPPPKDPLSPWGTSPALEVARPSAPLQSVSNSAPSRRRWKSIMRSRFAGCKWRVDDLPSDEAGFVRWICTDCGSEGYSRDSQPPTVCKRNLKPRAI
jgi:hypothetical protein